jgi:hypothetical protein
MNNYLLGLAEKEVMTRAQLIHRFINYHWSILAFHRNICIGLYSTDKAQILHIYRINICLHICGHLQWLPEERVLYELLIEHNSQRERE